MKSGLVVSEICRATGRGDGQQNEDVIGCNGFRAWVIDGGTDVAETIRPSTEISGSLWISIKLSLALDAAAPNMTVSNVIATFADTVCMEIDALDCERRGVSPICSVAVIERQGDQIKVSQVGDVTVYLPEADVVLCDDRFGGNESRGVAKDKAGSTSSILERRRSYLIGANGMWVVGDNALVAEGVRESFIDSQLGTEALIVSDGFARAISPYRIYESWWALYSAVRDIGPIAVLQQIREFESEGCTNRDHYKSRDDASAILVKL